MADRATATPEASSAPMTSIGVGAAAVEQAREGSRRPPDLGNDASPEYQNSTTSSSSYSGSTAEVTGARAPSSARFDGAGLVPVQTPTSNQQAPRTTTTTSTTLIVGQQHTTQQTTLLAGDGGSAQLGGPDRAHTSGTTRSVSGSVKSVVRASKSELTRLSPSPSSSSTGDGSGSPASNSSNTGSPQCLVPDCRFNSRGSRATIAEQRRQWRSHVVQHAVDELLVGLEGQDPEAQATHLTNIVHTLSLRICSHCGRHCHSFHTKRHKCSHRRRLPQQLTGQDDLVSWLSAASLRGPRPELEIRALRHELMARGFLFNSTEAAATAVTHNTTTTQPPTALQARDNQDGEEHLQAPSPERPHQPHDRQQRDVGAHTPRGPQHPDHPRPHVQAAAPDALLPAVQRAEVLAAPQLAASPQEWLDHVDRHRAGLDRVHDERIEDDVAVTASRVREGEGLACLAFVDAPTARTIPRRKLQEARLAWIVAMERVILAAGADDTETCTSDELACAWTELLSIPSTYKTTRPPRETGNGGRQRQAPPTVYQDDDDGSVALSASAVRRAQSLVEQSRISDAARALLENTPPVAATHSTIRALIRLHPQEPDFTEPEMEALTDVLARGPAGTALMRDAPQCHRLRRTEASNTEEVAHELPPRAGQAILQAVRESTAALEEIRARGTIAQEEHDQIRGAILDEADGAISLGLQLGRERQAATAASRQPRLPVVTRPAGGPAPDEPGDPREPDVEAIIRSERQALGRAVNSAPLVPEISVNALRDLVEHLPRHRAPGPSGLTYEMLVQLNGRDGYAWQLFTTIIRLATVGRAGPSHILAAAKLIALRKGPRAVRPIAVGETISRIAGLVMARAAETHLRDVLAPMQFGVAVAGGTEATGWAAHLARVGGASLCNVDVSNAFNSVSRRSIVSAVARHAPMLFPITWWALEMPTPLVIRPDDNRALPYIIPSATGTPQGWPLSPALFALSIHDTLLTARIALRHNATLPVPLEWPAQPPPPREHDEQPNETPGEQQIRRIQEVWREADLPRQHENTAALVHEITTCIHRSLRATATGSIYDDADLSRLLRAFGEQAGPALNFDSPGCREERGTLRAVITRDALHDYAHTAIISLAVALQAVRDQEHLGAARQAVATAAARLAALAAVPLPAWTLLWRKAFEARSDAHPAFGVPTELAAYADDVNIMGTTEAAVWTFTYISRAFAPQGMQVHPDKSKILMPGSSPFVADDAGSRWGRGDLTRTQGGTISEELRRFAPAIVWDGIDVTGTPVGTPGYCRTVADSVAQETKTLVDKLSALPAHHASLILRLSASTKFKHLLRVLPSETTQAASRAHDDTIWRALAMLSDDALLRAAPVEGNLSISSLLDPRILNDASTRRATMALHLPARFGGLGVIQAARVSSPAMVGAYALVASLLASRTPSVAPLQDRGNDFSVGIQERWGLAAQAIRPLAQAVLHVGQRAAQQAMLECHASPVHKLQRLLTRRDSEEFVWKALARMAVDAEDRGPNARGLAARHELAWRIDLMSRGSASYMHQIPTVRSLHLQDADVRAIYAMRIGVQFAEIRQGPPATCLACNTQVTIDPESVTHALACRANTAIHRHDGAKRELAAILRLCGATVRLEEQCVPQRVNPVPASARRIDLVVRHQQKLFAVDVTVTAVRLSEISQDSVSRIVDKVQSLQRNGGMTRELAVTAALRRCIGVAGAAEQVMDVVGPRYQFEPMGQPGLGRATPEDPMGLLTSFGKAEHRKRVRYGTSVRARDPEAPTRGMQEMPLVVFCLSTGGGLNDAAKKALREAAEGEAAAVAAAGRGYALTKARLVVSAGITTAVQRGNARIWRAHATRLQQHHQAPLHPPVRAAQQHQQPAGRNPQAQAQAQAQRGTRWGPGATQVPLTTT